MCRDIESWRLETTFLKNTKKTSEILQKIGKCEKFYVCFHKTHWNVTLLHTTMKPSLHWNFTLKQFLYMNLRNWSNLVPWIKPPNNGNMWPDSPGYGATLPSTTGALWAWQSYQIDDVPPAAFQSFTSAMKFFMWAPVTGAGPGGGRQYWLTSKSLAAESSASVLPSGKWAWQ